MRWIVVVFFCGFLALLMFFPFVSSTPDTNKNKWKYVLKVMAEGNLSVKLKETMQQIEIKGFYGERHPAKRMKSNIVPNYTGVGAASDSSNNPAITS